MKKQKNTSIKAKLLGVMLPVVSMIVVVLIFVAYRTSADLIEESSKNLLESSVKNQASKIESWLEENLSSFQMAKTTIENLQPDEEQLQKILDGYYGYSDNYPEGIYVADGNGALITASKSGKRESNPIQSTWYKEGLTRVNMAIGSAYQNEKGINVISASGILKGDSDEIRVISADMTLDRIAIIVNSFIEMKGAEAFLVDKTSEVILANRDSSLISKVLGASGQSTFYQLAAEKIKNREYDFAILDGEMTVFEEVEGTNWILVSFIPQTTVLSDLIQFRTMMIVIGIVCIAILWVLMERVTHVVIKPVKEMTKVITKMTSGDFTVSVKTRGNDEIAVMGKSVEHFITSMRSMIAQMGDISAKLKGQADTSRNVSGAMNAAAEVQSESMGELNTTVDQLSISVNEIAEHASQLAGVAADTKKTSDAVGHKMQETVTISEKGRKDMQQVSMALKNIQISIQNLEQAVNEVGTASGEIVQIINLIGSIAEETNLLSLNASIEAARAGEAGRGFAVVASEIGKLAKNSADSVSHITELITKINSLVENAVQQAGSSAEDVVQSTQLIHTAVDTFDTIFGNIGDTSALIGNVVEKINEVDQVATNVAAICEEQAASSDEILATSEAMLTQTKNISKNSERVALEARHLAESADLLEVQVKQFRIGEA